MVRCNVAQRNPGVAGAASAGLYFVPVLGSLAACVALALWWAVAQFHRENVLFREADRPDLGTWLRTAFRPRPPAARRVREK